MKYLLCLLLVATACGKHADPSDVIDQDLMIALGQAKNYHHKAKLLMSDGKTDEAIAAVRAILSLTFPKNAPEADDVRDDARAMLGKLLAGKGQLDQAMQVVDEGLAQSRRDSFFIANLHTVRGEILEQRALNDEADAAQPDGKARAAQHRHEAIEEYDRSIKIEEQLQKQLLEKK